MEMCGNDDFWLKIAFSRKIVQKSNKSHLPTGGAPKTDYDARNGNYSVSSFDLGPASSKMEKVSRRWSDFRKKDRLKRTFSILALFYKCIGQNFLVRIATNLR